MQRTLIPIGLVLLVMAGWSAHGQEVFSNGVDLSGSYLIGNGFIDMVAHTNSGPSDPEVRDYGPSIGQMYGVEPDTGNSISNPTNLLTLKPRQYDLGQSSNRVFVIAAEQLTAGSSISISYTNNLIYISVAAGSVGTASLNLTETDSRYVQDNGDTLSGDLDLGGNDLNGIDILQFDSGQLALSEGSGSHSRFSGQDAGILNTGDYWIGLGLEAGRSGTGDNVNAFGVLAGYSNEGSSVNAASNRREATLAITSMARASKPFVTTPATTSMDSATRLRWAIPPTMFAASAITQPSTIPASRYTPSEAGPARRTRATMSMGSAPERPATIPGRA